MGGGQGLGRDGGVKSVTLQRLLIAIDEFNGQKKSADTST